MYPLTRSHPLTEFRPATQRRVIIWKLFTSQWCLRGNDSPHLERLKPARPECDASSISGVTIRSIMSVSTVKVGTTMKSMNPADKDSGELDLYTNSRVVFLFQRKKAREDNSVASGKTTIITKPYQRGKHKSVCVCVKSFQTNLFINSILKSFFIHINVSTLIVNPKPPALECNT